MKNILILFLLCFVAFSANAQKFKGVAVLGASGDQDTLTNAATLTYSFGEDLQKGGSLAIGVAVTKVSGTVAGIIYYEGSADGTNYVTFDTDTLTDATNTYSTISTAFPFRYARVSVVGSGTSVRYIIPQFSYIK